MMTTTGADHDRIEPRHRVETPPPPEPPTAHHRPWTRRSAWLVLFDVVGIAVAIVVGESLAAWAGHPHPSLATPWWVVLLAGGTGTLVMAAAPLAGLWAACAAQRSGEPGTAPWLLLVLHTLVLTWGAASNALGVVARILGG
ncbi:MAG: hypothetical protein R2755_27760 [Acidimicrobiales bacterium]